jgi:hypothetical protein
MTENSRSGNSLAISSLADRSEPTGNLAGPRTQDSSGKKPADTYRFQAQSANGERCDLVVKLRLYCSSLNGFRRKITRNLLAVACHFLFQLSDTPFYFLNFCLEQL